MSTAALIIIGNEILSGRTADANLPWLSQALNDRGIQLTEARVIPDTREKIIETVNEMRAGFRYVFTTGGIGPTHDDITTESVAEAFGVPVVVNPDAEAKLKEYYGDRATEARMKMARIPEGAELIENPVSVAPGFRLDNVYVMAGVPRIMQAMFEGIAHTLSGNVRLLSRTVTSNLAEGEVAPALAVLQQKFDDVDIGSYPHFRNGRLGLSIVLRGTDQERIKTAADAVIDMVHDHGGTLAGMLVE